MVIGIPIMYEDIPINNELEMFIVPIYDKI